MTYSTPALSGVSVSASSSSSDSNAIDGGVAFGLPRFLFLDVVERNVYFGVAAGRRSTHAGGDAFQMQSYT